MDEGSSGENYNYGLQNTPSPFRPAQSEPSPSTPPLSPEIEEPDVFDGGRTKFILNSPFKEKAFGKVRRISDRELVDQLSALLKEPREQEDEEFAKNLESLLNNSSHVNMTFKPNSPLRKALHTAFSTERPKIPPRSKKKSSTRKNIPFEKKKNSASTSAPVQPVNVPVHPQPSPIADILKGVEEPKLQMPPSVEPVKPPSAYKAPEITPEVPVKTASTGIVPPVGRNPDLANQAAKVAQAKAAHTSDDTIKVSPTAKVEPWVEIPSAAPAQPEEPLRQQEKLDSTSQSTLQSRTWLTKKGVTVLGIVGTLLAIVAYKKFSAQQHKERA